ncbi:MAG: hypothetical protein H6680_01570 [Desulfobacteraceae bacterium]|nr:hypothetical protein [Desulfobacteraceae bacterium]
MPVPKFYKKFIFLFLLSITIVLTGCNTNEDIADDTSKEAEIERGLSALDDFNYTSAKNIFENLKNKYPGDNNLKSYYSNALAGMAGLDTYNLMATVDELDDEGNEGATIEIVGRTLSGSDSQGTATLTASQIKDKIGMFEEAIDAILEIADKDYSELISTKYPQADIVLGELLTQEDIAKLTNDELVQLGLMSINHAVLVIGDILLEISGESSITLTESSFKRVHETNKNLFVNDISSQLKKLSIDIELVYNAVQAIIEFLNLDEDDENDLSKEFELFRTELDNGNGDDSDSGDGYITYNELEFYLENL